MRVSFALIACCGSWSPPAARAEPLAECAPERSLEAPFSRRFVDWFRSYPRPCSLPGIEVPGPDLANFPNSSLTLAQGRAYIESTPFNLNSANDLTPLGYNSELLLRLGVTDNIEARVYSGGLTVYAEKGPNVVGFSPLTFDAKLHLSKRAFKYFNFSLGLEAYVQTRWGSPAFDAGIQYGLSLLLDHELPWELSYEWNLGFTRALDAEGQQVFVPTFQAALQRNVFDGFALFLQSYRNAVTLPRTNLSKGLDTGKERGTVFGVGFQWLLDTRWSWFGNFNVGFGDLVPLLSGSSGLAVAL